MAKEKIIKNTDKRFKKNEKKCNKKNKVLEQTIDIYAHATNNLVKATQSLDGIGFHYFVNYLHSPWRIIWTNFIAGVFRGLGILVGMTLVVAFIIWLLSSLVDFPLIGQYFKAILELLKEYLPETTYKPNVY